MFSQKILCGQYTSGLEKVHVLVGKGTCIHIGKVTRTSIGKGTCMWCFRPEVFSQKILCGSYRVKNLETFNRKITQKERKRLFLLLLIFHVYMQVEANHVFMLEPLLNAAVEAQAINRVHRGGQTRPTTVHRLVVRGTIEEEIERRARRR